MNRVAPLILVLAAVALVGGNGDVATIGGKPDAEKGKLEPPDAQDNGQYVVPEERAALAKVRRLTSNYTIGPTGHVINIGLTNKGFKAGVEVDLGFLTELTQLEGLGINDTPVRSNGLDQLPKLKQLTSLTLSGSRLRDEHMAVIGKLRQLRKLHYSARGVSAVGLAQLENLTELELLDLNGPGVDDAFMPRISRLVKVTGLHFHGTKVTDVGLKSIAGLVNLESLVLPEKITDTG